MASASYRQGMVFRHFPVLASYIRILQSREAVAMRRPSGENATPSTSPSCPTRRASCEPSWLEPELQRLGPDQVAAGERADIRHPLAIGQEHEGPQVLDRRPTRVDARESVIPENLVEPIRTRARMIAAGPGAGNRRGRGVDCGARNAIAARSRIGIVPVAGPLPFA
jgi:hypothetical protein